MFLTFDVMFELFQAPGLAAGLDQGQDSRIAVAKKLAFEHPDPAGPQQSATIVKMSGDEMHGFCELIPGFAS